MAMNQSTVHGSILVALLVVALGSAQAQNPQSPTQTVGKDAQQQVSTPASDSSTEQPAKPDPDVDPRCDFNPPKPALIAADYADYRVKMNHGDESRTPQELTETAKLVDGTRLAVVSDACVDSFGREFRLTFVRPAHAAKDTEFWAAAAGKALADLHLSDDVGNEVSDLRDFLVRAPKLRRDKNRVVQCHDSTQPDDDDCNWESHGSYILTIEPKGAAMQVIVSVDYSA